MTVPTIKVKVVRRPRIKVKTLVKFPANVVTQNFLTVTNSGGTYTFSIDYTRLGPGPVIDPTTAFVAVLDTTSGTYKEVTLASLLTSGLDADLQAIAALTGTGILVRTAANTWAIRTLVAPAAGITITNPAGIVGDATFALANDLAAVEGLAANGMAARTATDTWTVRTITGTANEITSTNGDGVAGNPTLSIPSALTFTGKTITGGTYASAVTFNKVTITAPATAATLTLIDGTTLTGPAASGTVMTLGNNETITGVKTFGAAGNVGKLVVAGTTSGTTVLNATAIASGTLTLPAATDTLIGKATTDILTNKTYDTAGAGNGFSINSLAATANTGTGAVVRATSPVLVTPALGTPTALVLTSATGLPLSGLNTQAAFTFVGNNTSGSAVPTAVDIHTLTLKASPAATDEVIISDQAASGAWKRSPVSSLAAASGVSSLNSLTGALNFTVSKQVFTASGTYTPTSGTKYAIVECVGSGGGGGGATGSAAPNQFGGGGGGSGSYSKIVLTAATIGASQTITVGAAGAGGAAGNNAGAAGADVSMGTLCIGKGGAGGGFSNNVTVGTGGAGGVAGTGDLASAGSTGTAGFFATVATVTVAIGSGASSIFGGGAGATNHLTSTNGVAATGFGSGGGGGFCTAAVTAAGGNGSKGIVFVTEFIVV